MIRRLRYTIAKETGVLWNATSSKYKAWKLKHEKVQKVTDNNDLYFSQCPRINTKESWYVNSGATSYMTNDKTLFNIEFIKLMDTVTTADDKNAMVLGKGSGSIKLNGSKNKVTLNDVLYVPDLFGNLLSVKKITEHGFKFPSLKRISAKY